MLLPRSIAARGSGFVGEAINRRFWGSLSGWDPCAIFYITRCYASPAMGDHARHIITSVMSGGGKIGAPPRERTPKAFAQTNPEPRAEWRNGAVSPRPPRTYAATALLCRPQHGALSPRAPRTYAATALLCRPQPRLSPRAAGEYRLT